MIALLLAALDDPTPARPADPLPKPASGVVRRHADFPSRHVAPRHVDVWIPDGPAPEGGYRVLLMHDGQMLFDAAVTWNRQEWGVDETLSALIRDRAVPPTIVVGVWNSGPTRASEFLPADALARLTPARREAIVRDRLAGEARSSRYLKFLVEEVRPFIARTYPVRTGPEDWVVGGSSMGGLISLAAFCGYPDVFRRVMAMSTHWPGDLPTAAGAPPPDGADALAAWFAEAVPAPAGRRLYLDTGDQTLDALYGPHQRRVDAALRTKGWTDASWRTVYAPGDDHSERAWARRLPAALRFLLAE